jgi:hypothetical protein
MAVRKIIYAPRVQNAFGSIDSTIPMLCLWMEDFCDGYHDLVRAAPELHRRQSESQSACGAQ